MSSSTEPTKTEPTKTEPVKADPPSAAPSKTTMDAANSKAANILFTQGSQAFVKHVFTDQGTGRELSYSEMRQLYG